jgi:hypothetical protein
MLDFSSAGDGLANNQLFATSYETTLKANHAEDVV